MASDTGNRAATGDRSRVGIAECAVATDDTVLTTSGLGSCLGVALYDERAGVAGLAHVMLPRAEAADAEAETAAKFADTGVERLLADMEAHGADAGRVTAKLAGASKMFSFSFNEEGIGERNVEATRAVLAAHDVPVVAEDVGGDSGRSLQLRAATGELVIEHANARREIL